MLKKLKENINFDDVRGCGYSLDGSPDQILAAHYEQILPWMKDNLIKSCPDFFLSLCTFSFSVCGLQCFSNDEDYDQWFSSIFPLLQEKIVIIKRNYNLAPINRTVPEVGQKTTIGCFFNPSNSTSEHMIEVCNYLSRCNEFEVHALFLASEDDETIEHLFVPEVQFHTIPCDWSAGLLCSNLISIRKKTDEIGLHIAFSSLNQINTSIIMQMDVAPISLYFLHFLHSNLSKFGIKHKMTYGSPALCEQEFANDKLRVIPSAIPASTAASSQKVNVPSYAREDFANPNEIILCSLAHSAKISQPDFLEAVSEILVKNPNTVFLYTSNESEDYSKVFFAGKGLSERVKNIGWVDLESFTPIIDILLDSFPLANGITLLRCAAQGIPIVSLSSTNSYFGRDIQPIILEQERRNLGLYKNITKFNSLFWNDSSFDELRSKIVDNKDYFFAKETAEYVTITSKLVNDAGYRKSIGGLMSLLYKNLYNDINLMGGTFERHLRDLLDIENISQYKANNNYILDSIIAQSAIGRCVNKCRFCLQSHPDFHFAKNPKDAVYADETVFDKMLSELPVETQKVSITPYTETMIIDNIMPRIKKTISQGRRVSYETSNVIFDENFYRDAMSAGLERVLVSINAPNRELYRRAHGRDNFDRIVKNLEKLIALRDECCPSMEIHLHVMLFEEFLEEYEDFYNYWKDKVDFIYLQGLCNWGSDKWCHIDFAKANLTPVQIEDVERYPCPFLRATIFLHSDNNYYMCGMAFRHYISGKPMGCLGSAKEITVLEAWNRMTYYRNMHIQKRWDELECCSTCNAWLTWDLLIDSPEFENGRLLVNL